MHSRLVGYYAGEKSILFFSEKADKGRKGEQDPARNNIIEWKHRHEGKEQEHGSRKGVAAPRPARDTAGKLFFERRFVFGRCEERLGHTAAFADKFVHLSGSL